MILQQHSRMNTNKKSSRNTKRRIHAEALEYRLLMSGTYTAAYLVSDVAGLAANTDPALVNPWGIASRPLGPMWVADNHSGAATIYGFTGETVLPSVNIPAAHATTGGAPTGMIFQLTTGFQIDGAAASFLFSTEDGTIAGWTSGSSAKIAVDNSATGAVYKGLALGLIGNDPFLYAPNFNSGHVDVFDSHFAPAVLRGDFTDPDPSVAANGFAPFNIAEINGQLYISYARQDADKHDDLAGAGAGLVDVFSLDGQFVKRLITGGELNSPWGMAVAPTGYGDFGGDLLVGNFGDGRINAFDSTTGAFAGTLGDAGGVPLAVPGLWALRFGRGGSGGNANTLFFTAGFGSEEHGLLGSIVPTTLAPVGTSTALDVTDSGGGQGVTLTATVTGAGTGLVSFWDQGVVIGSAAVNGQGKAALTPNLADGEHHLTAVYSGPGALQGSSSAVVDVTLPLVPTVGGPNSTQDEIYVDQLYSDLLHRAPDAGGLAQWMAFLDQGGSRSDVAAGIVNGAEFLGGIVDGLYLAYLGRHAESQGLDFWVTDLQNGGTVESVRATILGSQEFFNLSGDTSQGWVTRVYELVLGRTPDATGLATWTPVVTDIAQSRERAGAAIVGSVEARTNRIDSFYEQLLRREVDPQGLSVWQANLAVGVSETAIATVLASSPEYFAVIGIS